MRALLRYKLTGVFAISVLLLLFNLSRSPLILDEAVYIRAARDFLAGAPSTNPEHPPLAKCLIAASMWMFGDNPFGWRFASTLAGGLVAVAVFGITHRLTQNARTATIAWLLTIAGGFWFVMGRAAMLSIYELGFELAGVWFFLIAAEKCGLPLFAASGILFGLSFGCRWSGIVGLVACLIVAVIERQRLTRILISTSACLATYILVWLPLLAREHRPLSDVIAANEYILHFHTHLKMDPRFSEPWWTWIFRLEPKQSLGHLVANPVIGVLGLFAVAALLLHRIMGRQSNSYILSLLYLGHMGQWVIGIRTVTFYYYYLEPFVVLAPALAVAMQGLHWRNLRVDVIVTACSLAFFAYWYPTWASLPSPFNALMGAH